MPPITLLTDFGLTDTCVGQMRGVIAGISPAVSVIDLTHSISPQNILHGAIVWADAVPAFPAGTIHVGVVDPGVGTARRAVAAEIGDWRFIAPDNGLLTAVRNRWPTHAAVELSRREWHREPTSATFHGRDVFAPVAAHWAKGEPLANLGMNLNAPLIELNLPNVTRSQSQVRGCVLWPDHFGNLITNIMRSDLPDDCDSLIVEVAGLRLRGIHRTYGELPAETLLALWNSGDRLEIAASGASAAATLRVAQGAEILVSAATPRAQ